MADAPSTITRVIRDMAQKMTRVFHSSTAAAQEPAATITSADCARPSPAPIATASHSATTAHQPTRAPPQLAPTAAAAAADIGTAEIDPNDGGDDSSDTSPVGVDRRRRVHLNATNTNANPRPGAGAAAAAAAAAEEDHSPQTSARRSDSAESDSSRASNSADSSQTMVYSETRVTPTATGTATATTPLLPGAVPSESPSPPLVRANNSRNPAVTIHTGTTCATAVPPPATSPRGRAQLSARAHTARELQHHQNPRLHRHSTALYGSNGQRQAAAATLHAPAGAAFGTFSPAPAAMAVTPAVAMPLVSRASDGKQQMPAQHQPHLQLQPHQQQMQSQQQPSVVPAAIRLLAIGQQTNAARPTDRRVVISPHPMAGTVYAQTAPPTATVAQQHVQPQLQSHPQPHLQPQTQARATAEPVAALHPYAIRELCATPEMQKIARAMASTMLHAEWERNVVPAFERHKRDVTEHANTRVREAQEEAQKLKRELHNAIEGFRQWCEYDRQREELMRDLQARADAAQTKYAELQTRFQTSLCLTGKGLNLVSEFPSLSDLEKRYRALMSGARGDLIETLCDAARHDAHSRDLANAKALSLGVAPAPTDGGGGTPDDDTEHRIQVMIDALMRGCYSVVEQRIAKCVQRLRESLQHCGGGGAETMAHTPSPPFDPFTAHSGPGAAAAGAAATQPSPSLSCAVTTGAAPTAGLSADAKAPAEAAAQPPAADPHALMIDALYRFLRQNAAAGPFARAAPSAAAAGRPAVGADGRYGVECLMTARDVFERAKGHGGRYLREMEFESNAAADVRAFVCAALHLCWLCRISSPPLSLEWRADFSPDWYTPTYDSDKAVQQRALDAAHELAANAAATAARNTRLRRPPLAPATANALAAAVRLGVGAIRFPVLVSDGRVLMKGEVRL